MIKLDVGRVPEGHSHLDLEAEASDLEACLEDGRLESPVNLRLDLDRRGADIFIKGMVEARAVLGCSRCLNEYSLELEAPLELWCIVGGESDAAGEEDRENVVRISPGAKFRPGARSHTTHGAMPIGALRILHDRLKLRLFPKLLTGTSGLAQHHIVHTTGATIPAHGGRGGTLVPACWRTEAVTPLIRHTGLLNSATPHPSKPTAPI